MPRPGYVQENEFHDVIHAEKYMVIGCHRSWEYKQRQEAGCVVSYLLESAIL